MPRRNRAIERRGLGAFVPARGVCHPVDLPHAVLNQGRSLDFDGLLKRVTVECQIGQVHLFE